MEIPVLIGKSVKFGLIHAFLGTLPPPGPPPLLIGR
jgi:hypothetical protein